MSVVADVKSTTAKLCIRVPFLTAAIVAAPGGGMTAVAAYPISNACRSPAFFLLWQDKFWSAPSSPTLANVKEFGTTFHL